MTTTNEELISMLRAKGCPDWVTARWLMESSADLLQSQAEHIAMLEALNELAVKQAETLFKQRDALRAELADAELHTKQVDRGLDKATAQLAAIRAQDPVIDFTVLRQFAEQQAISYNKLCTAVHLAAAAQPAQDVKDAARYRWLREQHWSTDTIAVVLNPKQAVKLGYVCPYDSLLDETIDAAIAKGAK